MDRWRGELSTGTVVRDVQMMFRDIQETLPFGVASGGLSWRVRSREWAAAAEAVAAHLGGQPGAGAFQRLKERKGRYVFRCVLDDTRFIGKSFKTRRLSQKLWRWRRYASCGACGARISPGYP